jgi:hypothetical protein
MHACAENTSLNECMHACAENTSLNECAENTSLNARMHALNFRTGTHNYLRALKGARGIVVGWCTTLQAGRLRVRCRMQSCLCA